MIAALLAFVVSALVLAWVATMPSIAPQDQPNERSLHERAVPRAGGWAIFAGWAAALPFAGTPPGFSDASFTTLAVALAAIFVVSLVDDYRGVAPAWRIVVQSGAAIAVAMTLASSAGAGVAWIAVTAFVLVAACNFYNFMDGSDGLAGAMATIGFAALAAGAALAGAADAPWLALACAALPFLVRNGPPARIFLGDAGSVPLGFLAASGSIAGVVAGTWPLWFPVLVFLPFLADATVTLIRRALRGERVWQAHRSHYYQRLVQLGAGHRGTLAAYAALMLGCGASAIACVAWRPAAGPGALAAWIAIIALLFAGIDYHGRKRA